MQQRSRRQNVELSDEETYLLHAIRDKTLRGFNYFYKQVAAVEYTKPNLHRLRINNAQINGQSYFHYALTQTVSDKERQHFDQIVMRLLDENRLCHELDQAAELTPDLEQKLEAVFNVDGAEKSTLISAIEKGHLAVLKRLLKLIKYLPANFSNRKHLTVDKNHSSMLHIAVLKKQVTIVKFLIKHILKTEGIEALIKAVNVINLEGNTPLHCIDITAEELELGEITPDVEIATMLICAGADMQIKNFADKLPSMNDIRYDILAYVAANGAFIGANISLDLALSLQNLSPNQKYIFTHTQVENKALQLSNGYVVFKTNTMTHRNINFAGALYDVNPIREWMARQPKNVIQNIDIALQVALYLHPSSVELKALLDIKTVHSKASAVREDSLSGLIIKKFFSQPRDEEAATWLNSIIDRLFTNSSTHAAARFEEQVLNQLEKKFTVIPNELALYLPDKTRQKLLPPSNNYSINSKPRERKAKLLVEHDDFLMINSCLDEINLFKEIVKNHAEMNVQVAVRGFSSVTFCYATYAALMSAMFYLIYYDDLKIPQLVSSDDHSEASSDSALERAGMTDRDLGSFVTWMVYGIFGVAGLVVAYVTTMCSYNGLYGLSQTLDATLFTDLKNKIKTHVLDRLIEIRTQREAKNPQDSLIEVRNIILTRLSFVLNEFERENGLPRLEVNPRLDILRDCLLDIRKEMVLSNKTMSVVESNTASLIPEPVTSPASSVSTNSSTLFAVSVDCQIQKTKTRSIKGKEADSDEDESLESTPLMKNAVSYGSMRGRYDY